MSAQSSYQQVSPEVYGYDYNIGPVPQDIFSGGQWGDVPSSDGAAVNQEVLAAGGGGIVDDRMSQPHNIPNMPAVPEAVNLRGEIRPQGYPWQGHGPPQGYPWQGHPPSAPLMGPGGSSPIRRGGPNMPAYTPGSPYPTMDTTTNSGYPLTVPSQMAPNPGQPMMGYYGGIDLGNLDMHLGSMGAPSGRSRTESKGGYTYEQFSDGSIKIVATSDPAGQYLVGQTLTSSNDPSRWQAITDDIGTWQEYRSGRLTAGVGLAQQLLQLGTQTYTQIRTAGQQPATQAAQTPTRVRRPVRRASTPAPTISAAPIVAPSGVPSWVKVVGGVAGAGVLLFALYRVAGGKD